MDADDKFAGFKTPMGLSGTAPASLGRVAACSSELCTKAPEPQLFTHGLAEMRGPLPARFRRQHAWAFLPSQQESESAIAATANGVSDPNPKSRHSNALAAGRSPRLMWCRPDIPFGRAYHGGYASMSKIVAAQRTSR